VKKVTYLIDLPTFAATYTANKKTNKKYEREKERTLKGGAALANC